MMVSLILAASLIAFSLCVAFAAGELKHRVLLALAVVALVLSMVCLAGGRAIAFLPLLLSAALLPTVMLSRSRKPRRRWTLGGIVLLLTLCATLPLLMFKQRVTFPELEGPYQVGVREGEVLDKTRGNAWNAIDQSPRRLLIRIWYPTPTANANLPTNLKTEAEKAATSAFGPAGFNPFAVLSAPLSESNTHSRWVAPPAPGPFPLLVFSHGYAGSVSSNAVLMEQLASWGYVVVSMTHPGESASLVYLDGNLIPQATEMADVLAEHAASGLWEAFKGDTAARMDWTVNQFEPIAIVSKRVPIWVKDFTSVLNALSAGTYVGQLEEVLQSVNFNQIGFLGMSAGGTAAPAACHDDTRCNAVVALDGGLGLPFLRNKSLRSPALIFDGAIPSRLGAQDLYYEPHAAFGLNEHIHRIVFPENGHSDFTDLALVLTPLGKRLFPALLPVLGPVDGAETLLVQSRLAAAFFAIHLRQQNNQRFPQDILAETNVARPVDPEPFRKWAKAHSEQTTEGSQARR